MQPKGASGRIVASLLDERSFELIVSPAILAEIRRSLTYPKVRRYIKISDEDLDLSVAALALVAQPVEGSLRVNAVADDPDDNKYLEAALEGRAQYIVTGDSHLKFLKSYRGIRIVTPRVFLDLL